MTLNTATTSNTPVMANAALHSLQVENEELQRYLAAQKKILASLERRVGRSLESLGVKINHLSQDLNQADTWQRNLEFVQDEVSALCDLLSDAMLLQKFEAGKVDVDLQPLALETVLNSTTRHLLNGNDLKPSDRPQLRLICEFDQSLPTIWGDQDMLEAVLTDLLARSLRYSDDNFPVVLGVQAIDAAVHIYITAQRFAPIGNRDFATEIVLCCRRIEAQQGRVTCQQRPDGLQTVTLVLQQAT